MHLKINIATRVIKISQNLLVEFYPILNIGVALYEYPQQTGLFGVQNTAQPPIGERPIAHEGQTFNLHNTALRNLKNHINPVVRSPNDPRFDRGGYAALIGIGLSDGIGIITHLADRIDPPRLRAHQSAQLFFAKPFIAFKHNFIDRRKFNDSDLELVALDLCRHSFKQV